jgi:DNA-binding response OmpR family regulator
VTELKILLIEDTSAVARLMKEHLTTANHTVTVMPALKPALTELETANRYDLVITDLGLPDARPEVVIPALCSATAAPILVYSGSEPDEGLLPSISTHRTGFLQKPFTPEQLVEVIAALTLRW